MESKFQTIESPQFLNEVIQKLVTSDLQEQCQETALEVQEMIEIAFEKN